MNKNKTVVLILSAGNISKKLPFLRAEYSCPALIPVHTRPLGALVIEKYAHKDFDVHLFVEESVRNQVASEIEPSLHGYTLHGLHPTGSVVETLENACAQVAGDDVIVNLVTSLPIAVPEPMEAHVAKMPGRGLWSAISDTGDEIKFYKKGAKLELGAKAFTGIFRVPGADLLQALNQVDQKDDLLAVVEQLSQRKQILFKEVEWLDFGHEGNYHASKAMLINSRSFNSIKVNRFQGTLIKTSRNEQKLALEANYLSSLPEPLKILFPRLLDRRDTPTGTESYRMEYYGYSNLAEYLLYWNLSEESWWCCFEALDMILSFFRAYPASIGSNAYFDFLYTKTENRICQYLESITDLDFRRNILSGGLKINGAAIPPLDDIVSFIKKSISQSYNESRFCIFHGDLCFNNILYDASSGIIRLIDPRGSFGESFPGIYGDHLYDLAKIAHSSTGNYDYLVNGLYSLHGEGQHMELNFPLRPASSWLDEMTGWLINKNTDDPKSVNIITGSLFLSMCPLHKEDKRRQTALFLRGLQLINNEVQ